MASGGIGTRRERPSRDSSQHKAARLRKPIPASCEIRARDSACDDTVRTSALDQANSRRKPKPSSNDTTNKPAANKHSPPIITGAWRAGRWTSNSYLRPLLNGLLLSAAENQSMSPLTQN